MHDQLELGAAIGNDGDTLPGMFGGEDDDAEFESEEESDGVDEDTLLGVEPQSERRGEGEAAFEGACALEIANPIQPRDGSQRTTTLTGTTDNRTPLQKQKDERRESQARRKIANRLDQQRRELIATQHGQQYKRELDE